MADIKAYVAGEDINAYRIVSYVDTIGLVGGGNTNVNSVTLLAGVSGTINTAAGEIADITVNGIGEVQLGGTVGQFDVLTTNSDSKAIKAVANTVSLLQTVGMALMGGVSGDVIPVAVNPGRLEKI